MRNQLYIYIFLLIFFNASSLICKEKNDWILHQKSAFFPTDMVTTRYSPLGVYSQTGDFINIIHAKDQKIYSLHSKLKQYTEITFQEWQNLYQAQKQTEPLETIFIGNEDIAGLKSLHYQIIQESTKISIPGEESLNGELPGSIADIWIAKDIPVDDHIKPFLTSELPMDIEIPTAQKGALLKIQFTSEEISKIILETTSYELSDAEEDLFKIPKSFKKLKNPKT